MRLVKIEYLRWLSECGALELTDEALDKFLAENTAKKTKGEPKDNTKRPAHDYAKNRPIILKADGRVIGEPYDKEDLEFGGAVVHDDSIHYNVTSIERRSQESLNKVFDDLQEERFLRFIHRIAEAGAS